MDECANCGERGFTGHACLKCGKRVGSPVPAEPPPPPPSPAVSAPGTTATAATGGGRSGFNVKKLAVLAGAGFVGLLVVVMAVGLIGTLVSGDQPQELAATDDQTTSSDQPTTAPSGTFCDDPQPQADVPLPSAEGGNLILNRERRGATGFEGARISAYSTFFYDDESVRYALPEPASDVPPYALCLSVNVVPDATPVTCTGYDDGIARKIWPSTTEAVLFERATAERVAEYTFGHGSMDCPQYVQSTRRDLLAPTSDMEVAVALSEFATPGTLTFLGVERILTAGEADWCDQPIPIEGVDSGADGGLYLADSGWPIDVMENYRAATPASISHIACHRFEPGDEEPVVCEFEGGLSYRIVGGSFTVKLIEAATGQPAGETVVEGSTGCPAFVLERHAGRDRTATIPDEITGWLDETLAGSAGAEPTG